MKRSLSALGLLCLSASCGDVTADLITREQSPAGSGGTASAEDAGCAGACASGGSGGTCATNADCEPPPDCTGVCDFDAILCHPSRHQCVECVTDGHCDDVREQCSTALGVCAIPCQADVGCNGEEPICDLVVGFCVECREDADCDADEVCRKGECL